MRVQILSDLHNEFGKFRMPEISRDLLILAGDVDLGTKALEFLQTECSKSPVIYVLGNHEFYHNDFDRTNQFWKTLNLENLYVLENRTEIIRGVRFIGATLWTDMNRNDPESMKLAAEMMNDYHVIYNSYRNLEPEDTVKKFWESREFLEQELKKPFSGKTVVITHHLPSEKSVADEFLGAPLNCAFVSKLDRVIADYQPVLWIHGHTHKSFDYKIKNTRIICNPRGYYPTELNDQFNPNLILEI